MISIIIDSATIKSSVLNHLKNLNLIHEVIGRTQSSKTTDLNSDIYLSQNPDDQVWSCEVAVLDLINDLGMKYFIVNYLTKSYQQSNDADNMIPRLFQGKIMVEPEGVWIESSLYDAVIQAHNFIKGSPMIDNFRITTSASGVKSDCYYRINNVSLSWVEFCDQLHKLQSILQDYYKDTCPGYVFDYLDDLKFGNYIFLDENAIELTVSDDVIKALLLVKSVVREITVSGNTVILNLSTRTITEFILKFILMMEQYDKD